MDGTLVDTEPLWIDAERELVSSFGGSWDDAMAHQLVGNALTRSAEIIRENSPVTLSCDQIVDYLLERVIVRMREHLPWRPGAEALLQDSVARGIPNALVTMSYYSFAEVLMQQLPPGTFDAVVTGDRVSKGKPDPEAYLTAVDLLGVTPADCVAIEDSLPGVSAAVGAGIPTIAVPHIVQLPPIDGAVAIDTLAGLTAGDLRSVAGVA